MTRRPLSALDDWELVHEDQDLRGRRLLDQNARPLGTVTEMIVDTDDERVDAIVLDNGREVPAHDFQLVDGNPVLLATGRAAVEGRTIPLREEELLVRKRPIQVGAVEIRKGVVTESRTVDVPVTREELVVERQPVAPRPADRPIGAGETIEVPLREEQVTVEKQPVVYEQVNVGKHQLTETREVAGTIRKEVAEVDTEGDVDVKEGRGR